MTEWHTHVEEGWQPIVKKACEELDRMGYVILQVKEKFGGLRIYYACPEHLNWEGGDAIVTEAERKCWETCEICGEPGKTRNLPWIKTLCGKHYAERKAL